jgi:hypothetical protein
LRLCEAIAGAKLGEPSRSNPLMLLNSDVAQDN